MSTSPPERADQPSAGDASRRRWPTGWLLFWAACLAVPLPLLVPYLVSLWPLEHYQYFPLALLAVALMAHGRWDRRPNPPAGVFGWALLLGGLLAVAAGIPIFSPWLGAVGFVLIAAAALWSSREPAGFRLLGLALPLLMILRLPLELDELLIIRLQGWTTRLASWLLDLVAIPHLVNGNVIELTSRELFVAEACSGIQSVFTLLFLASLLVAYKRHPIWFVPGYWLAAVLAAMLGNSLRVAIVAVAEASYGLDWATGLAHDLVGYTTLLIASLLLLSFDQFAMAMLHPIQGRVPDVEGWTNPLVQLWDQLVGGRRYELEQAAFAAGGASLALDDPAGTAQQADVAASPAGQQPEERPAASREAQSPPAESMVLRSTATGASAPGLAHVVIVTLGLSVLSLSTYTVATSWSAPGQRLAEGELRSDYFVPPAGLLDGIGGDYRLIDYEVARDSDNPRLGKAADIWTFGDDALQFQVVLSQPYFGWKELCVCYENLHWRLVDRAVLDMARPLDTQTPSWAGDAYALARFQRESGRRDAGGDTQDHGYLLFSALGYDGQIAAPPASLGTTSRLTSRIARGAGAPRDDMMMLQLWLQRPQRLDDEQLRLIKDLFWRARIRVIEAILADQGDLAEPAEAEPGGDQPDSPPAAAATWPTSRLMPQES